MCSHKFMIKNVQHTSNYSYCQCIMKSNLMLSRILKIFIFYGNNISYHLSILFSDYFSSKNYLISGMIFQQIYAHGY